MLTGMEPAIYSGTVRHRRFQPASHEFTYSLFMAFLDIDRIPQLMEISPLSSYNRWNWACFDERDHLGDPRLPLRERLGADAARHGVPLPDGPIFLLTHLRYLGYNFNPVSFFYCYDRAGDIQVVLAEVNNTFGGSYNYWLWRENRKPSRNALRYQCAKLLHVSPFMTLELDYDFLFTRPGETLTVHMETLEEGKGFFDATLLLEREPWNAKSLHRALRRHPWMTAKVIAAIHWQALKLYLKKVPFYHDPGRLRTLEDKIPLEGKENS